MANGNLAGGSDVWGLLNPQGYLYAISEDGGLTWGDDMWLIEGIDDMWFNPVQTYYRFVGGMDNELVLSWGGMPGENDLEAPVISDRATLSSFMLGEPWVVGNRVTDNVIVNYTDVNWAIVNPDAGGEWKWLIADSADIDDEETQSGMYWYTMPSDSMHGQALAAGDTVWFYIYADDGGIAANGITHWLVVDVGWGVEETQPVARNFGLGDNYPNPFNNTTVIPYTLDRAMDVQISVFDVNGRLVESLVNGSVTAGQHTAVWAGEGVTSGVYFYTLEADGVQLIKKMTLIR